MVAMTTGPKSLHGLNLYEGRSLEGGQAYQAVREARKMAERQEGARKGGMGSNFIPF